MMLIYCLSGSISNRTRRYIQSFDLIRAVLLLLVYCKNLVRNNSLRQNVSLGLIIIDQFYTLFYHPIDLLLQTKYQIAKNSPLVAVFWIV